MSRLEVIEVHLRALRLLEAEALGVDDPLLEVCIDGESETSYEQAEIPPSV